MQINETVWCKKTEENHVVSKWSVDMAIQSQFFGMHVLTSQLYILQRMSEKHTFTYMLSCSKAPNQNTTKTWAGRLLYGTKRAFTLAPAIILVI